MKIAMISECNNISQIIQQEYDSLIQKNLDVLKPLYDGLIDELTKLYKEYTDSKSQKKQWLEQKLNGFNQALNATFILNRVFLTKSLKDNGFEKYFLGTNIHISKLQSQFIFDINYRIQQIDGEISIKYAKKIAKISLILAILSLIIGSIGVILTYYYGECQNNNCISLLIKFVIWLVSQF